MCVSTLSHPDQQDAYSVAFLVGRLFWNVLCQASLPAPHLLLFSVRGLTLKKLKGTCLEMCSSVSRGDTNLGVPREAQALAGWGLRRWAKLCTWGRGGPHAWGAPPKWSDRSPVGHSLQNGWNSRMMTFCSPVAVAGHAGSRRGHLLPAARAALAGLFRARDRLDFGSSWRAPPASYPP